MTLTKEQRQTVAETIISQLGGFGRLRAMVNARDFVALESGLQFKFSGDRKHNVCRVILEPSDTYKVEFGQVRKLEYVAKHTSHDVYCDQLVELFESTTGLYLSL